MKIFGILLCFLLIACHSVTIPPQYIYQQIDTGNFTIASWQKISNPQAKYKIYIEGDGHAFNSRGLPTQDPTPRGTFLRELAFSDPSPNVVYLARPCQFIMSKICSVRHWSTARFAPEIINAEFEAIQQIVGNNPVILIGFSGGAQIAGLVSSAKSGLNVEKIITIGGNLDHLAWTKYHKIKPLNESMNLADYQQIFKTIPQHHYVGENDYIIPLLLVRDFVGNTSWVSEVENASHNKGWESIYPIIWQE